MNRLKSAIITVFFTGLFSLSLFPNNVFGFVGEGQKKEVEIIKQIEDQEKEAAERVVIIRPAVEYSAENERLKDPFQKPASLQETDQTPAEAKPLPALAVQGVIWGGRFPQAIINDTVVKVGDTLEGVKVTKINKDGVIVFFDNREYNLSSPAQVAMPAGKPKEE
jgi:hypothetical protein